MVKMKNNRKFAIQKHICENDIHWDLMLEAENELETYRLNISPEKLTDGGTASAEKIFNHPLKFLTYEGPVNKGKGMVEIADAGIYEIIAKNDTSTEFRFTGRILKGKFILTCAEKDRWKFSMVSGNVDFL
jgi:hypothetical protein